MNLLGISQILCFVVGLEGIFFMIPALIGLIYKEYRGSLVYFLLGVICILVSRLLLMLLKRRSEKRGFYGKEGFVATALSWIIMSLIGALPFFITKDIPNYLDAVFETVSGFTTTGASVVPDVEVMLHCNLFFRSFTHWLGGMGVLVFILAITPMSGGSSLSIMKAESPGPTVSKLVPKAQQTSLILYGIYIGLTVIMFVLLVFDPSINVFQCLCHTLGTAGTGGFGVLNDSVAGFSPYVKWVTTIFMVLFGMNFSFYYLLLMKKIKDAFCIEEIRWYLGFYISVVAINVVLILGNGLRLSENILDSAFTCASVMSTTGYSICDFGAWPQTTHIFLIILMFIGGCAGSTGGGFKVTRVVLLLKQIKRDVQKQLLPNSVIHIRSENKPVSEEVIKSTNTLFITYVLLFVISWIIISFDRFDLHTSFGAVISTFNNIGVGVGDICVGDSYGQFSYLSKLVMIFDMLFGRLEIVPMMLLFAPRTWKK